MSGARIGINSIILVGSEIVRQLISLAVMILIARTLAIDEFGVFRLTNAFLMIFLVLSNFGLVPLVTKKIAEGAGDEARLIGRVQGLKIALSIVTVLLTCAFAIVLGYDKRTLWAIFFTALVIPAETLQRTHVAWYDGRQKMIYSGVIDIARSFILLLAVLVALFMHWGLFGILAAYFLHYIAGEVLAEVVSGRYLLRTRPVFSLNEWKPILREGLPYLLIGAVWIVTFRIDMVMLSRMKSEFSVGYYGAAYGLFEKLLVLPIMFSRALFPALTGAQAGGLDALMMRKSMRIFFLLALPVGTGMAMVSKRVLVLFFGKPYAPAAPTLAVLSFFLFVWFCTMGLSWALTARGRLNLVLKANVVALLVNVGANFVLIPAFDYLGAAVATVASECIYLAFLIAPVHRELLKIDWGLVHPGTLVSTAVMAFSVWYFWHWPLFALIAIGAVIYVASAWITGALREPYLLETMKNILGRRAA